MLLTHEKLLLSDLQNLRVVCRKCGAAVEIPIDKINNVVDLCCPGCPKDSKTALIWAKSEDLSTLANALMRLKQAKDVEIEFVA
jgi:hypothetical protein